MPRIVVSGGRFFFLLVLVAALAYGLFRFYEHYVREYVEHHPAGQEHRPDVFGF